MDKTLAFKASRLRVSWGILRTIVEDQRNTLISLNHIFTKYGYL